MSTVTSAIALAHASNPLIFAAVFAVVSVGWLIMTTCQVPMTQRTVVMTAYRVTITTRLVVVTGGFMVAIAFAAIRNVLSVS